MQIGTKSVRARLGWASAFVLPALLVGVGSAVPAPANPASGENARRDLDKQFTQTVRPFLTTYCVGCHGKEQPQAQLDFTAYPTMAAVSQDLGHWFLTHEKLMAKQMPPDGSPQPTVGERAAVVAWISAVRQYEIQRTAGDPGPVLARRLSNAEYDYTIRDLTCVDMHPTREFPVDPANQEGFDNSGESLTLSPALMKKYVQAAKEIADHLVLTSTGLEFASHPVLAETDRDKFCILRIVDFYKKQPTDFADYFEAAWQYRYRAELGKPDATLESIAADSKISLRYLKTVWDTLSVPAAKVGPLATLQTRWNALPAPNNAKADIAHVACEEMRDWVIGLRKKIACKFDNLSMPRGFSTGSLCVVLWKDRQYASHRRALYRPDLQIGGVGKTHIIPAQRKDGQIVKPERVVVEESDPDLFAPQNEAERAPYLASFDQFCNVFPDAFYVSERGRMFINDPSDKGRLLSAGLHNSMGYFRDDTPLMEMVLDDNGRRELNNLWRDFDTVAYIPERTYQQMFTYERAESQTIRDPEFKFARPEDKSTLSDVKIRLFGELYMAKARRNGANAQTLEAMADYFRWVSYSIRSTEKTRLALEPIHRRALLDFAARAYRRPLTLSEQNNLMAFYRRLCEKDGETHEDALRDTVIAVLMSPNFLFRFDLEDGAKVAQTVEPIRIAADRTGATPPNGSIPMEPLDDYALASRLSYFLWSSMPDAELLAHAKSGDLHRPDVLRAQTRRMLKDDRIRALALEFGGNWLDFRRFEEHNAVDRDRFPVFTNELREAMFEEPVRFLTDEFQENRSVLDMLYGRYTFVNATLAKHYGMTDVSVPQNGWARVDNADKYGRGGILPMAVFLTRNSPGLRTSPVKRGYWMVRRVLGEHIPPPPANVPELPKDEAHMGELTLRQTLAKHRENPACASCHARFDSYGLVFEGYGPVGERRARDLGGRPVDTNAPFPVLGEQSGVSGLQTFLHQQRQKDFVDTLNHKLFAYALGRSLQPSDDPALFGSYQRLVTSDYRFGSLVESIVTSPQFLNRRASAVSVSPVPSVARN